MSINPALAGLQPSVGHWRMELYNAGFLPDRDTRVSGSIEIDWIEDGSALRMRQGDAEHPGANLVLGCGARRCPREEPTRSGTRFPSPRQLGHAGMPGVPATSPVGVHDPVGHGQRIVGIEHTPRVVPCEVAMG